MHSAALIHDFMKAHGWSSDLDALRAHLVANGANLAPRQVERLLLSEGYQEAGDVWVPVTPEPEDEQLKRLTRENTAMRQLLLSGVMLADEAARVIEGSTDRGDVVAASDERSLVAGLRAFVAGSAAFGGKR